MSAHENLIKIFEYALTQEEIGKSFSQYSLKYGHGGSGECI
ncbi:MAG: hypothetical protein ACETWT_05205 [Thermodesulfobacteriota bacterium]|jgi:hypothetical protein